MDYKVEEFEKWVMKSKRLGTHIDKDIYDKYKDNRVSAKWSAWKAAIDSIKKGELKCL